MLLTIKLYSILHHDQTTVILSDLMQIF